MCRTVHLRSHRSSEIAWIDPASAAALSELRELARATKCCCCCCFALWSRMEGLTSSRKKICLWIIGTLVAMSWLLAGGELQLAEALPSNKTAFILSQRLNREGPYVGLVVPNPFEIAPLLSKTVFKPHPYVPWLDLAGKKIPPSSSLYIIPSFWDDTSIPNLFTSIRAWTTDVVDRNKRFCRRTEIDPEEARNSF